MVRPYRNNAAALDPFIRKDFASRVWADEVHGVFMAEPLDRLRVGVVLMVVGADEQVDIELFGRNQNGRLARQVDSGRSDIDATIRQVKIGSDNRTIMRFENESVLSQPPQS